MTRSVCSFLFLIAAVQALTLENAALKAELAALRERLDRLEATRR